MFAYVFEGFGLSQDICVLYLHPQRCLSVLSIQQGDHGNEACLHAKNQETARDLYRSALLRDGNPQKTKLYKHQQDSTGISS